MYRIILIIITIIVLLFNTSDIYAASRSVDASAQIKGEHLNNLEVYYYRVRKLRKFLERYNSPLAPYSKDFVYWADFYDIDWRLVPAISGVESTFGKRIPAGSYNAYGWNNGNYRFVSWEDSIEHVTMTLRTKYKNKGAVTVWQIARRYAPPSSTWAGNVSYFMNKIDSTPIEFDLE